MRRLGPYLNMGVVIASCAALIEGCSEELGPERFPTTRVSGVVRAGGRPVTGGWIEFVPVEGAVGNLRSAPIGPDGTFVADRVAVGTVAIGVVGAPLDGEPGQVFRELAHPIRRTIPDGPSAPLEFDLLEEAILYRRAKARGH
jgi:hypothetical protein